MTAADYRYFGEALRAAAGRSCPGRLVALHEGGYSEMYGGWLGDAPGDTSGYTLAELRLGCCSVCEVQQRGRPARPAFGGAAGGWRCRSARHSPDWRARAAHASPPAPAPPTAVPFCGLNFIEALAGLDSRTRDPIGGDVANWCAHRVGTGGAASCRVCSAAAAAAAAFRSGRIHGTPLADAH